MEKEIYTAEEVKAMLEANGLSMKDLAKTAKAVNQGEVSTKEARQKKHETTWTVVLQNYPDFVIERKTAQTQRRLVIMPSCNGKYVQDMKTNDVYELTESEYKVFTAGMPDMKLNDDFWIQTIMSGKTFFTDFIAALKNETYIEMIKNRCAPKYDTLSRSWRNRALDDSRLDAYKKYPILYREYANDEEIVTILQNNQTFIQDIIENFGLENVRDFLNSWKISLFKQASTYSHNVFGKWNRTDLGLLPHDQYAGSCRPRCQMAYSAFKEYTLYTSVRMGYGLNAESFWCDWNDSLKMQMQLYGKIKEKYPKDLPTYHLQLSYKHTLNKEYIDAAAFAKQSELTQKYEMKIGKYQFIAQKVKQDFFDEATQQANCLASYVGKYTEGKCHIIFMRLAEDPTTSLVTIELIEDKIVQAYQAHNAQCTPEQREALDQWLKKVIKINSGEEDKPIKPNEEKK